MNDKELYAFENELNFVDILDAVSTARYPLLFQCEDQIEKCTDVDNIVLREATRGIEDLTAYNTMRLVEVKGTVVNEGTYIRLKMPANTFDEVKNMLRGIENVRDMLCLEDGSSSSQEIAETIIKFINEARNYTYESFAETLVRAQNMELDDTIMDYEDLGRRYADDELEYSTVCELEDFVDWDAFGESVFRNNNDFFGFFSDHGFVFIHD